MLPFGRRRDNKRVQGMIGYFGLEDLSYTSFSDQERDYIRYVYQPMGAYEDLLISGMISYMTQTLMGFLYGLAGWFTKQQDRPIAYKILKKAEELLDAGTRVLDVDFFWHHMVPIYYKDWDRPGYLDIAISACKKQIAVAPQAAEAFHADYASQPLPGHKGYKQVSIILEKQKDFEDVIRLC
ncbi:MAG: hypothetical protein GX977_01135 [Firmicutes bacterium]|jgi:hypothetical protein|nr:hypothetical protein [Bacillota bacterium]